MSWEPLPDDEERPEGMWTREELDSLVRSINDGYRSLDRSHIGGVK